MILQKRNLSSCSFIFKLPKEAIIKEEFYFKSVKYFKLFHYYIFSWNLIYTAAEHQKMVG